MTREEAIKWLSNLKLDIGKTQHQELWHYEQAIDDIIEVLGRKSCVEISEDCIDRYSVLAELDPLSYEYKEIKELPSVVPSKAESNADLISRQDALDAIAKFVPYAICDESTESYTNGLMDAYNLICQLPSAQLRGMSKYIKLEDAIHAIAENMAQEANLKEHCNEPTFCAGEFLVEAEMSVKDLPTIEVSNDCISCPNCGADMRGDEQ